VLAKFIYAITSASCFGELNIYRLS